MVAIVRPLHKISSMFFLHVCFRSVTFSCFLVYTYILSLQEIFGVLIIIFDASNFFLFSSGPLEISFVPTHFSSFLSSSQFDRSEQANALDAFPSFPFPFFFVFVRIHSFNPFLDDLTRNILKKRWFTVTFDLSRGGWEVEEGFSILLHSI